MANKKTTTSKLKKIKVTGGKKRLVKMPQVKSMVRGATIYKKKKAKK